MKGKLLQEIINALNISVMKFEQTIGVSVTRIQKAIENNSSIKLDVLNKIIDAYPQVSKEWLYTGKGEMFISDNDNNSSMANPLRNICDELIYKKSVKNQSDFCNKIEYDKGYVSNLMKLDSADIPDKMQKKLHDVFGVSIEYMSSGHGEMFESKEQSKDITEPIKPPKKIPIIGEAAAGDMQMYDDNSNEVNYIDVGDLLRDSEAAFTVYGNSMNPNYPSGCILGIKRCYDGFIQPGEIYLLETKSNRVFKRLYYNDEKTGYVCHSDNIMIHEAGPMKGKYYYPPFEVSFTDVIRIHDVTGMIKRTRNSGIINRPTNR